MQGMRSAWAVLVTAVLSLSGCKKDAPPVTDSQADWEDIGRYATCTNLEDGAIPCGDEASFDMSGCDTASLGNLPGSAIYTLVYRYDTEPPTVGVGSFRFSQDENESNYFAGGWVVPRRSASSFYLTRPWMESTEVTRSHSLVGCRAEGNRLYGCYANCRNGALEAGGTFMAVKWEPRPGESEASGLRLVSESVVQRVGDTPMGEPVDVYVTQGHAYVVSIRKWGRPGGLTVFDVRNPSVPVIKRGVRLPTDNYWNGVWGKGNALYVASADTGVIVFDISDPAVPRMLRSVPSGRGPIDVHTVFVEGDRLYAMSTGPQPKTLIFDIQKPTEPKLLGEYAEPGAETDSKVGFPHDARAFEGRLYINHWSSGYVIVDVSDPEKPERLGSFVYPYAKSHANVVGRFGKRLIAFEGGETWGAHLRVLDVTDPAEPKRIGEYRLEENASIHNMVLKGNRLYVAYYQHGVRVLDVSVPESPSEVAYFNTFEATQQNRGASFFDGAIGIHVPGDGYVYVIDTWRGLLIFPEPP